MQFADSVRSISSTQLDLVGLGLDFPQTLAEKLGQFDEVISWYGTNRAEFRREMIAIQPRCSFLDALPIPSRDEHATDFFLGQVGGPKGAKPRIAVDAQPERGTVVIHPFSGGASKNWPMENFQQLATQLPLPAEWTVGPDEELAGANRFDNLLDLARWMRGAALYVGNDSGISHLAAAIGLPGVVLFGLTNPSVWAPRGDSIQILRHNPLNDLGVAPVLKAIEEKL